MTTIAYKDGIIAYDSRMTKTDGTLISDKFPKKIERDGVVFIVTGGTASIERLIRAYLTGDLKFPIAANAVVIDGGKVFYIGCNPDSSPPDLWKEPVLPEIPEAWGSGTDHALTAMDLGRTAEEAVRVAMQRDLHTGGDIHTIKVWFEGKEGK